MRRAAWDGRMHARRVGNQWLVLPSEVERFLRDGQRRPTHSNPPDEGEHMTRVIAIGVPKGGTGKTTTTINLGAALAEQGKKVLLVDFDPQGNLTQAMGLRPADLEHTVYSAIKYFLTRFESQLELAIQNVAPNIDLVPTSARLNLANDELAVAIQREQVLEKLLAPIASRYDFILIDTLPYLGVLVVNALVAANEVIIPLQAEYLATESVSLILDQVQLMRRSGLNPKLQITGILLTMVDQRVVINREAVAYSRKTFGSKVPVFDTMVKRSVRFTESQARHQSILQYDPNCEGAKAYRALAAEVLSSKVTVK
ncbi:MAG: ParA family protein [Chloroflexi bacterium]|uniref:ParA family protein n=1 Tax=Candidatus Chlorohelix allophototropha TaxID=3003348 RepID=A0A8T7MAQ6_9CHLR|nr:ParA family protein [Chloroflexota bacterium]WJW70290.1 ParA family protein [Chloroflexota bacterium L227-S17]